MLIGSAAVSVPTPQRFDHVKNQFGCVIFGLCDFFLLCNQEFKYVRIRMYVNGTNKS